MYINVNALFFIEPIKCVLDLTVYYDEFNADKFFLKHQACKLPGKYAVAVILQPSLIQVQP